MHSDERFPHFLLLRKEGIALCWSCLDRLVWCGWEPKGSSPHRQEARLLGGTQTTGFKACPDSCGNNSREKAFQDPQGNAPGLVSPPAPATRAAIGPTSLQLHLISKRILQKQCEKPARMIPNAAFNVSDFEALY